MKAPVVRNTKRQKRLWKINDDAAIAFANSLANYSTITDLMVEGNEDNITCRGWSAFETVLCNQLSIIDSYRSNHTLCNIRNGARFLNRTVLPGHLKDMLQLNRDHGRSQAAHMKIIMFHFSDCFNAQPLLDLDFDMNDLPHVIAWICRNSDRDERNEGFSLLLDFVRSMPMIYDLQL